MLLLAILPEFHWKNTVVLVAWGFDPQGPSVICQVGPRQSHDLPTHIPLPDTLTHDSVSAHEVPAGQLAYQGWGKRKVRD